MVGATRLLGHVYPWNAQVKAPRFDPSWADDVKALYAHDMREIWDKSISRHIWNQYHNQLETYFSLVDRIAQGRSLSILDVGCAQATLAIRLAEIGHRVVAVDIRRQFLDYARTRYTHGNIEFVESNALELSLDRKFDLVFANQIIEHMTRPEELLSSLKRLIRSSGTLVVTTPSNHYLVNELPSFHQLGDLSDYAEYNFSADADGHFFSYKCNELLEIFESVGFENACASFFETPFVSGHMKVRYLHGVLPPAVLRFLDRCALRAPGLGRKLAHQLMVVGQAP